MYKCEHCKTEFEGRFCPKCGSLPSRKKSGGQAAEIPKAFQSWQIVLMVIAVAAAASLLLVGMWYAKDSTDQAVAELNLTRLENSYLQTPDGQPQNPIQNPNPEIPVGSLTVPEPLGGDNLTKVFDTPMGYYGQKVEFQGTMSGWIPSVQDGMCLEISVFINGEERMVGVHAQQNEDFIPQGTAVTIKGQVSGVNTINSYNGYDIVEIQATEDIQVVLTDGNDTVLRELYMEDEYHSDDPDFSDLHFYFQKVQFRPDKIICYLEITNYSDKHYYTANSFSAFVYRQFGRDQLSLLDVSFPVEIAPHASQDCYIAFENTIDLNEMFNLYLELQITNRDTNILCTYSIPLG